MQIFKGIGQGLVSSRLLSNYPERQDRGNVPATGKEKAQCPYRSGTDALPIKWTTENVR